MINEKPNLHCHVVDKQNVLTTYQSRPAIEMIKAYVDQRSRYLSFARDDATLSLNTIDQVGVSGVVQCEF
jgi:hypothetical protein